MTEAKTRSPTPRVQKWRRGNRWFGDLRQFVAEDRALRGPLGELDAGEVLRWADAHFARAGKWPTCHSGTIPESAGETWLSVEAALVWGLRGLPPGSTVTRFLARHRGKWHRLQPRRLSVKQILAWADAFHQCTGRWPLASSGAISGISGLGWGMIDKALRAGRCGLPGGSSLSRLLAAKRGVPNRLDPPRFTKQQILRWIDAFHRRSGSWPNCHSGAIAGGGGVSWYTVDTALRQGGHGFPGGSSLIHLLVRERKRWSRGHRPRLTVAQILRWADAFHEATGSWPTFRSGPIAGAPGETWSAVHQALYEGLRGFSGGSSLASLLARERGVRNIQDLPRLKLRDVLRWAKAHQGRTGAWPTASSGPVLDAPGEKWANICQAMYKGLRGFPRGTSLAQLLKNA